MKFQEKIIACFIPVQEGQKICSNGKMCCMGSINLQHCSIFSLTNIIKKLSFINPNNIKGFVLLICEKREGVQQMFQMQGNCMIRFAQHSLISLSLFADTASIINLSCVLTQFVLYLWSCARKGGKFVLSKYGGEKRQVG